MSLQTRLESAESPLKEALEDMLIEETEGRLIQCLDDGFVRLVDYLGGDDSVVRAARVSYGKGTKKVNDDRNLIRYLLRHYHTTPFEMVEFIFHIRIPMDAWRQMVRHRTASINEYSTRYSEAIDSAQISDEWRAQATDNKQGSKGSVSEWPNGYRVEQPYDHQPPFNSVVLDDRGMACLLSDKEPGALTPADYLTGRERFSQLTARAIYDERLKFGVAREQARKDLPLSTYTEAYWKCDLHNLLHFLRLRMDSHAQLEIRTYANAIGKLIKPIVPFTWQAFEDYRLKSMQLTRLDIEVLSAVNRGQCWKLAAEQVGMGKREVDEFKAKAESLGFSLAA